MKHIPWLCLLILCSRAFAAPCPAGQTKDAAALVQIEQAWARALEHHDTAALGCILADEFEDAGPDGQLADRAATLDRAARHPPMHHELSEMRAQVHGDFGYIRGLATAIAVPGKDAQGKDAQGKVLAKVRFTDIYVYRDGRWQAVAAHESLLPAKTN